MRTKTSSAEASRQLFMQLAFPHMNLLYGVAYRLTGNRADAEDMVQDTYLKAYRFFHRFEPGTNFRAWIYRIMINLYRSRLRQRDRRPKLVLSEQLEGTATKSLYADAQHGSSAALDRFGDEVQSALDRLSPKMRVVVELVDIRGLSYRESAEILGCPVGTVMSRLYRARGRLQRSLTRLARSRGYGSGAELRALC